MADEYLCALRAHCEQEGLSMRSCDDCGELLTKEEDVDTWRWFHKRMLCWGCFNKVFKIKYGRIFIREQSNNTPSYKNLLHAPLRLKILKEGDLQAPDDKVGDVRYRHGGDYVTYKEYQKLEKLRPNSTPQVVWLLIDNDEETGGVAGAYTSKQLAIEDMEERTGSLTGGDYKIEMLTLQHKEEEQC